MPDDDTFDALGAAAELEAALAGAAPDLDEEIARVEERLARASERELTRRTRALLLDFLPVLDDLERALEAARGSPVILAGLELVERTFLAALARHGVARVPALGERFDPAVHEGVSVILATEAAQHDRVVAVLRSGYRLGDELLRAASVVIAKAALA